MLLEKQRCYGDVREELFCHLPTRVLPLSTAFGLTQAALAAQILSVAQSRWETVPGL